MASTVLTPPDGVRVLRTPAGRMWFSEGIVHEVIEVSHLGLEEVRGLYQGVQELVGDDTPALFLADVGPLRSASSEARAYAASDDLRSLVTAHAFIVRSPVARIIVGFFVRVFHPPFPVRLFSEPCGATAWLHGQPSAATGS